MPDKGVDAAAVPAGERKQIQAAAPSVDQFNANGWYWNPTESGTGFMFEAQGNRGFVGFFMYEEGSGKPVWYVSEGGAGSFVANADGSYEFTGELRHFTGGQPAWSPTYVTPTFRSMGTVRLRFVGQDATVYLPSRTQTATRFNFNGLASTPSARQPETGWYWNPAEGGRGYAIEVQNNRLFMAMFHYNQDGSPTWNVLEADITSGSATGSFLLFADGQSITSGYRGGSRHEAGTFNMSFRNPCAGQVQLAGAAAVSVRRFVFGGLPAGAECHALAALTTDVVPGVQAGEAKLQPGDAMHGRIDAAADIDAYGIALQAGITYRFELKGAGSTSGTLADPILALHDPALARVAENNNAATGRLDSLITYTPPASGIYYLAARANGTGIGTFVLTTTGVAADLVAQPVLPAANFAGALTATMTGADSGTASLLVDAAGSVSGTVRLQRGINLVVSGNMRAGGVLTFASNGVGGSYSFSGIVGPQGKQSGTWTGTTGAGLIVGQSSMSAPAATALTVRARGTLYGGVGPTLVLRVDGAVVGSVVVQATVPTDYRFTLPALPAGAKVDLAFTNDASGNGEDRNLFIHYLSDGQTTVLPTTPSAVLDRGANERAFDGLDVVAAVGEMYSNAALRLTWPGATAVDTTLARKYEAARLLQQASFGPTVSELNRLVGMSDAAWINEQIAMPASGDFVAYVQGLYNQNATNRPNGSTYDTTSPIRFFWNTVATGQDQLRKRTMFALHSIIMVSQADSNLYSHTRAYANYLDTLNRHAFGNYRNLLEDIALSPVMGIYLSHIRNRKEDPATGRLPDENFAREVMQLFSIGLHELNQDGSNKLGANGQPIETYSNADVMAMAKVFTGWSWGFPDAQLTDSIFRNGNPNYAVASDTQIDLQRMKPYPNQHSTSEKRLFAGRASAVVIPASTPATDGLRIALDSLFNHPNVGPFIGKQLIQRLVTSNPSPAYVSRVAGAFNNNGQGVRGDMGAVVRAILLDPEARQTPNGNFGKLKEPVLRVAQWMRAFGATSTTGNYLMAYDLDGLSQRPFSAPSVFSYFRPGYIPPNSAFADAGAPAPEFQLVNETTTPAWVNLAENMAGSGLGWTGSARDVVPSMAGLTALATSGNVDLLVETLNQLLFAGRMPRALRTDILDAVSGVTGSNEASHLNRARVAVFVALSSPEFLIQR